MKLLICAFFLLLTACGQKNLLGDDLTSDRPKNINDSTKYTLSQYVFNNASPDVTITSEQRIAISQSLGSSIVLTNPSPYLFLRVQDSQRDYWVCTYKYFPQNGGYYWADHNCGWELHLVAGDRIYFSNRTVGETIGLQIGIKK